MIVNKPQFDVDKIKPGEAYWLTRFEYNRRKVLDCPVLIRHVKPLSISLGYYDGAKGFQEITVDINSVVNGTFELTPMEKYMPIEVISETDKEDFFND